MQDQTQPLDAGEPILCPTGLSITVRGMTVKEERILSDQRALRSGRFVTSLLRSCVSEITDYGPYNEAGFDWKMVAQGDRFVALMAVRIATYGANYSFKVGCPDCREPLRRTVDLSEDLKIKECPEASLEAIKSGGLLEAKIGESLIRFRIPTGLEEERAAAAKGVARAPLSTGLKIRVVEVEQNGELLKKRQIDGWLESLPLGLARDIRAAFEEAEFGVDTTHEFDCTECGAIVEIDLPFGREFWLPS